MFKTVALFLGLAGSVAAQTSEPPNSVIAGYLARSDATEHLDKDLIQEELENLIGSENCTDFAKALPFYDGDSGTGFIPGTPGSGVGTYFSTIPTYGLGPGQELAVVSREYTRYYDWSGNGESPEDRFTDHWARRAMAGTVTKFARGNANFGAAFPNVFTPGKECVGFEECLKKGLSYTSTLYEAFQLAQKAIDKAFFDKCIQQVDGCTAAVDAWDSSVAIYVGSLEGTDGNNDPDGDYGVAPYALADKRCRNFRNCGPAHRSENEKDKTSPINVQVLALYAAGSQAAYSGNYYLMYYYLRLISNKVAVPLIQGTLRYVWKLSSFNVDPIDRSDKSVGEMGAFAFGALPKVWACSKKGEKKIFAQTKVGGIAGTEALNYENVKLGFECNYRCLGITCKDVGALYDGDAEPKEGAEACNDKDNGSVNVCSKPKRSVKQACKQFRGDPGIKGRDKLKFDQAESIAAFPP